VIGIFHLFVESCLQNDSNRKTVPSQFRFSPNLQKANNDANIFSWILNDLPPLEQPVKIANEVKEKIIARLAGEIVPQQCNCGDATAPKTVSGPIFVPQPKPKPTDPLGHSGLVNDNGSQFKITRQKVGPS
jgi:hypothetical protein